MGKNGPFSSGYFGFRRKWGAPPKNNFYHHKRHQKGGIYMGMKNSYDKVCSYNFKNIHTGVNLTPPQSPEGLMETYSH